MTGRELVTASLRLIGAVAPGESLNAAEATDALAAVNRMISSWSLESLMIYTRVREEFTLTANDQSYTMGSGADFNTTRPVKIEEATIELQNQSPMVEVPLRILRNAKEWSEICAKESTAEVSQYLYVYGSYPNETLELYPKPTYAHKLVLYSWKPLTAIASLTDSLSFPPGYERALVYNAAIELSPEYGKPVSDAIALVAVDSKAAIKRQNHKPEYLKCDSALVSRGHYDINLGDCR